MGVVSKHMKLRFDNTAAFNPAVASFADFFGDCPNRIEKVEEFEKHIVKAYSKIPDHIDLRYGVCQAALLATRLYAQTARFIEGASLYLDAALLLWPESSGDFDYPIKSYYQGCTAEECFKSDFTTGMLWKGEGKKRREVLVEYLVQAAKP